MNSTAFSTAADYAQAVREALGDLPPDQIRSLVDGLDEHLAEIAADGTTDLGETLGPPDAYAADLRAAAGLPVITRTIVREPSVAAPVASASEAAVLVKRNWWPIVIRVALAWVLALLLFLVIRGTRPVSGMRIVAGALAVGGAWWVLRWAVARAQLSGVWATAAPIVLGGAVIVGGVLAGAHLAGRNQQFIYLESPVLTTAVPIPGTTVTMPNVVGLNVGDAEQMLAGFGFDVTVEGSQDPRDQIVVWTDPVAGTTLAAGSHVRMGLTYPVASTINASTTIAVASTVPPLTTLPSATLPTATAVPVLPPTSKAP